MKFGGTGIISDRQTILGKPKKVHAVRVPLTVKKLKDYNINCPDVYGDPAIILPRIYTPKKSKKYKLGVILHKLDINNKVYHSLINNKQVLNINIHTATTHFIDLLNSCEVIASSSLHGLIVADSYGIPRIWLYGEPINKHGTFKFYDYFLGMQFSDKIEPFNGTMNLDTILEKSKKHSINAYFVNKLIETCPFNV